jgi:hypothetical protein
VSDYLPPAIRRGRISQLTIYEVTEDELMTLARGGPESVLFNLAVFFASIAGTAVVALLTATMSIIILFVFIVVAVATTIAAITLLMIWRRRRVDSEAVVARIKDRLPPQGEAIPVDPAPPIPLDAGNGTEVLPSPAPTVDAIETDRI